MDGNGTEQARFAAELARRRAEAGLSLADVTGFSTSSTRCPLAPPGAESRHGRSDR